MKTRTIRRQIYLKELENARFFIEKSDDQKAWLHLERAHILGQNFWMEHLYVHLLMFGLGLKTLNMKEIFLQLPRILLAIPGSVLNRAPKGNVGTSRVGIFEVMPIETELQNILEEKDNGRQN